MPRHIPTKPLNQHDRRVLAELRKALEMKSFSPSLHCSFLEPDPFPSGPVVLKTDEDALLFIKARTRLWRQSWIFPVLDALINRGIK